jgi:hypothetical protein
MTKEEIEIFAYNQGILRNLHKRQTAVKQRMILDKCRDYETNKRRERGVRIRFSRNTLFEF